MSDLAEVYFAPDGARLLRARALAADFEIRLATVWPTTRAGRRLTADDYPEPDPASGYERKLVRAGQWQIQIVEGGILAEAPMFIFRLRGEALGEAPEIAAWLLVDRTSGQLIGAGRYRVPVMIATTGITELEVVAKTFDATSPLPRSR